MAQPAHSPTARERSIALRSSAGVREALDCSGVEDRPSLAQTRARFRQPRNLPDVRFGGEAPVRTPQARAVTQPDWAQTRAEAIAAEAREDAAYDSHRRKLERATVPRRPQDLDPILFDETATFGQVTERGEGAAQTLRSVAPPPPLQTTSDPVRFVYGGQEDRQRNLAAATARDLEAAAEAARAAAEREWVGGSGGAGGAGREAGEGAAGATAADAAGEAAGVAAGVAAGAAAGSAPGDAARAPGAALAGTHSLGASQAFRPPDLTEFDAARNTTVLQKANLKRAGLERQVTRSYGPGFDPEARFGETVRKDPTDTASGAVGPAGPYSGDQASVIPLAQSDARQRRNPPPGEVRAGVMPPPGERVFGYVDRGERVTVADLTRGAIYDDRGTVGGETEMNSTAFQRTRYHYHDALPRSGAYGMTYGEDPASSKPGYLGGVPDGSDFGVIGQLDLYRPKR